MSFYAVSLLKRKAEKYLNVHDSSVDPSSREMLEFAYKQIESSVEFCKRLFPTDDFRRSVSDVQGAIYRLRNALKSHFSKQTGQQSGSRGEGIQNLEKEIHFFTETMHRLEEEYAAELYNSLPGGEEEEDEVVSDELKSEMVGFSDHYNHLKQMLTDLIGFKVVALCGMPGIGKTTLAREMFEDPDIVEGFDCRVWVIVGRKYRFEEIPRRILVELSPDRVEEDVDIVKCLNESLKGKRYLIVLDDIWDKYAAKCLQDQFPDEHNGSRLLAISRLQQVDERNLMLDDIVEMELMNKEESWHLLREKVFGQDWCPSQLETTGRKIAEKCEGLPLTIVTVANLLSKEDKTVEYWNEVATRKKHQLFKAAYDEILKVLLPSFKHLPPTLQMCFMYVGVFPVHYKISRSRLIDLWVADGFLELNRENYPTEAAILCLEELVTNNMVMIHEKTINANWSVGKKQIKTCRLHSSLWHLSIREGRSSKFSYVLDSCDDGFGEDIRRQPRLSFHNNILFAIKAVHKSVEDNCASTACSLLCYGPYHQYQVPICFGLRLLNKLDALTIRLYEFPIEVLQLVELRYLALTLNGNLPAAISQLSKVEFLIVHPHQSIKSSKESSYLPVEIWNMKELRHLQVMGKDLPNPCGASLKSLSTLSSASLNSCTVDVFRAIPNLSKLGIQVELSHENDDDPSTCLAHVGIPIALKSLKCVVVNPKVIPSFFPLAFHLFLDKLTLNGLGYAWEEMSKIGSMEFLDMLKLRNYAFRGPEWEVREGQFPLLRSLIIEDTDLERWRIGHGNLGIERLILKRCYKLKEIHGEFRSVLRQIEMVDCNPVGVEQMKKATSAEIIVSCSWYDKKPRA